MRPKLTYANVVATLALFIAIGGAGAFAATQLAKNSVGSKQLKKNVVTTAKIKKEAVTAAKVKKGTLTGTQIDASTLGTVPSAGHAASAENASTAANATKLGDVPASRYLTRTSTLQSGETEIGVWGANSNGGLGIVTIEFNPRLAGPIDYSHEIYIGVGAKTDSRCSGFGEAAPSYLCVYTVSEGAMTFFHFLSAFNGSADEAPGEPQGTAFDFSSTGSSGNARGNWAYTAP